MRELTKEDKIDAARMDLILNFPFYGSIFLRMDVFEDPDCPTAWTDGTRMGYNIDYMCTLEHEQIIGVFAHEVLHIVLKHHLREAECKDFQDKHTKWNYAADYSLNPIIMASDGMGIHEDWLYKKKWDDSTADEIFYQLNDKDIPPDTGGCDSAMPGEVRPFPGDEGKAGAPSAAEVDAERQKIDQWIRAAQFKAQGAGKLPGCVKELIKTSTAATVCWQDELIFLCEEVVKNNYTWTRPNQRYMQFGVYLPSMNGRKTVDMIFYVDTSGSLSQKQLEQICAEVQVIVQSYGVRCIVVYWDTAFRGMEIFEPNDVLEPEWGLDLQGGGGTDFEDCWTWMEENSYDFDFDPKAMVFFSDLECRSFPEEEPGMPILWCQVPEYDGSFSTYYEGHLPDYGRHVKVPIYREG